MYSILFANDYFLFQIKNIQHIFLCLNVLTFWHIGCFHLKNKMNYNNQIDETISNYVLLKLIAIEDGIYFSW